MNNSVLGVLERPALSWMAQRLPSRILPNHLTALGMLGAVLTAAGFIFSRWSLQWLWLASLGLIGNWLGDSLDGNLARYRRIERPRFGFFIDHTSDMFSQAVIFLAIGASPCAHFGIACLGLIAFLLAFVYTLIGVHVHNTMRITYSGFGPTEIRALLLLGNLLTLAIGLVHFGPVAGYDLTGYDFGILALSAGAAAMIAVMAVREGRAISLEDPPPK